MNDKQMTEERAEELLQQYRDTFGPAPGHFPNFPCVHVDLASGVDYSVEQHPIQADHASVDDKGNVTWHGIRRGVFSSKGHPQNLPKYNPPRHVIANPLLGAPYGKTWSNMTPDDIYKDVAGLMKKVRTPAEQLIQHRLTKNWTISHGTTTISYAPNSAVDIPVLVVSKLLDNGVVEVVESCQGEAAVKRARYYLERFEARMKR